MTIDISELRAAWATLDAAIPEGAGPSHDALIAFSRAIDHIEHGPAPGLAEAALSLAVALNRDGGEFDIRIDAAPAVALGDGRRFVYGVEVLRLTPVVLVHA